MGAPPIQWAPGPTAWEGPPARLAAEAWAWCRRHPNAADAAASRLFRRLCAPIALNRGRLLVIASWDELPPDMAAEAGIPPGWWGHVSLSWLPSARSARPRPVPEGERAAWWAVWFAAPPVAYRLPGSAVWHALGLPREAPPA